MGSLKKTNVRRGQVRRGLTGERWAGLGWSANADSVVSMLLWLAFVVGCALILSLGLVRQGHYFSLACLGVVVVLLCVGAAVYIIRYESRLVSLHARAAALIGLFLILLAVVKAGAWSTRYSSWATTWGTGTAVIAAVILTIAYDQRFALGMSLFYCLLATWTAGPLPEDRYHLVGVNFLLTMGAGVVTCCFSLREIRTRMKLLEVATFASIAVFVTATTTGFVDTFGPPVRAANLLTAAGYHATATFVVVLLIQSLLPVIEKTFRIATSMTLLDYTDANQPLLKRLAMEAPGTFSHSLLIGSLAEAAAEAIGANGLLCRVGAYYHDIGKINKPKYFIENEMGSTSKHKELSPTMSQLVIAGHVKDGIEMAREYGLARVLWQFIETHHGTTLIEPFYNEAWKKYEASAAGSPGGKPTEPPPAESEFRYGGPKPQSREAAIVMLADAVEGAVRSLSEVTPGRVEAVVHNMAMKRLQDGQFDECDLTLRELSQIEASIAKTLAAHYHARIPYPTAPDVPEPPRAERKSGPRQTVEA